MPSRLQTPESLGDKEQQVSRNALMFPPSPTLFYNRMNQAKGESDWHMQWARVKDVLFHGWLWLTWKKPVPTIFPL